MQLDDPVDDGDVPAFNLEDEDFTSLQWFLLIVGQEEKITTIECRLHTPTAHTKVGNNNIIILKNVSLNYFTMLS